MCGRQSHNGNTLLFIYDDDDDVVVVVGTRTEAMCFSESDCLCCRNCLLLMSKCTEDETMEKLKDE